MTYLFFLNVVMLTRLGYLMRETPAAARLTWVTCAVQVLALGIFVPRWQVLVLAGLLVAVAALTQFLERRGRHLAGSRSLAFLALALGGAILLDTAEFAPWSRDLLARLGAATVWTQALDAAAWQRLNVVLFGLLLLTNEVNLVIRYAFYRLNLEPKVEAPEDPAQSQRSGATDERQYNAGRVIGILERYFILTVLVAGADFAVIAVILAAKGFARFKQLDRREFAEYILIGTLASTLSAVVVALLVAGISSPSMADDEPATVEEEPAEPGVAQGQPNQQLVPFLALLHPQRAEQPAQAQRHPLTAQLPQVAAVFEGQRPAVAGNLQQDGKAEPHPLHAATWAGGGHARQEPVGGLAGKVELPFPPKPVPENPMSYRAWNVVALVGHQHADDAQQRKQQAAEAAVAHLVHRPRQNDVGATRLRQGEVPAHQWRETVPAFPQGALDHPRHRISSRRAASPRSRTTCVVTGRSQPRYSSTESSPQHGRAPAETDPSSRRPAMATAPRAATRTP